MPVLWSSVAERTISTIPSTIPSTMLSTVLLLLAAAALDFALGDPWGWPHPVQAMGKVITLYCDRVIDRGYSPSTMKALGVGLAFLLIAGTAGLSAGLLIVLAHLSPILRWGTEWILLASCFAGRSLRRAAMEVLSALPQPQTPPLNTAQPIEREPIEREPIEHRPPLDDLMPARQKLARYVGRDTAALSAADIRRAVLETISENAIDGVLAPLFYAILGGIIGLSAPAALAYKAASTLDSMVGYREPPYTDLGWFSARLEDALTWIPCRLSVVTVAVLSGHPIQVLQLCQRDAPADPSPNAGWSECAYAAALGVQLGGANTYRGKLKQKPALGEAFRPITDVVIEQGLQLTRRSFLVGLGIGILLISYVSHLSI